MVKFVKYYHIKKNICYIEHSKLFKYANDYFFICKGNIIPENFMQFISKKDDKIYTWLQNKKLKAAKNKYGKIFFIWVRTQNNDFVNNRDFTFWNYLFTNKNVYLSNENLNSEAVFYTFDYIYAFKNQEFVKTEPFNKKHLHKAYIYAKNCKRMVVAKSLKSDDQKGFLVYLPSEIFFLNSDFSAESERLIINALKQEYKNVKDTFMIELQFYNIENAICVD